MDKTKNPWSFLSAKKIPGTIDLDPAIYRYISGDSCILDIGCGSGRVSASLASHVSSITGIDINNEALQICRSSFPNSNESCTPVFAKASAISLPFADGSFDLALMQAVLTTIVSKEDRSRVISEAHRVLKPGAYLYLADFGQTWHSQTYRERYIRDLSVTNEIGSFLARDEKTGEVAFIAHHFTEKELVFLLIENGFSVDLFKWDEFVTRTGNRVNGFVVVAKKS